MGYIDGHCHLADPRFGGELEQVLARAAQAGIDRFVFGGVDPSDWDRQLELMSRHPGTFVPAFGLHPWFVIEHSADPQALDAALAQLGSRIGQARALGELGLDFGKKGAPETHQAQLDFFRRQLELNRSARLPVVLHIVKAHSEAIQILKDFKDVISGGIVHSFSASREIAEEYLRLGLSISVGGPVAKKGFETLKRAVVSLPLDRLVLESDSPDQAPEAPEGGLPLGLNEPKTLWDVAQAISSLRKGQKESRGESAEDLMKMSRENLIRIFRLES